MSEQHRQEPNIGDLGILEIDFSRDKSMTGFDMDGDLSFHSSGSSLKLEAMMPTEMHYYIQDKGGVRYKLEPKDDITPIELYHVMRLKEDMSRNYSNPKLTEYLLQEIGKHKLTRHFPIC